LVLFSIVGMQIFPFVRMDGELNKHVNFKNFSNSFLLLMRAATGEGWNAMMMDVSRPHSIMF